MAIRFPIHQLCLAAYENYDEENYELASGYFEKLIIIEPYKDYPADKAGLKAGDEIIKIGNVKVADFKEWIG